MRAALQRKAADSLVREGEVFALAKSVAQAALDRVDGIRIGNLIERCLDCATKPRAIRTWKTGPCTAARQAKTAQ